MITLTRRFISPFTVLLILLISTWVTCEDGWAQASPSSEATQSGKDSTQSIKSEKKTTRPVEKETERRTLSAREYEQRMRQYIRSGDSSISIYHVVAEILDDVMADVQRLRLAQVSPMAIRGVAVSPNLSPLFAQWVEGELTSRFNQSADISIRYCASCQSLRTSVEGGEWVLKLGWSSQKDMETAAELLGVNAFLDAHVSFIPEANQVIISFKIFSAKQGQVLWAETYTSDQTTAAILRSGERVMTREEAYRELTRKIEARPYYGYQIYFGGGMIPYEGPPGNTDFITAGIRFYEKFGEDKANLFGIFIESAVNVFSNPLFGAFFGGIYQRRINRPNLNDIQLWGGGALSFFLAGVEGNTLAMESTFDAIMQFRLGLGVSLYYAVPVEFAGFDLGGFGYKFRFTFNF